MSYIATDHYNHARYVGAADVGAVELQIPGDFNTRLLLTIDEPGGPVELTGCPLGDLGDNIKTDVRVYDELGIVHLGSRSISGDRRWQFRDSSMCDLHEGLYMCDITW